MTILIQLISINWNKLIDANQEFTKKTVEDQVKQLIAEISQYPALSLERQKALNALLKVIQKLPGIYRVNHQDYPEAFNQTLEWVSKNIDKFTPNSASVQQSFIVWINGYLKWRIHDLYIKDHEAEKMIHLSDENNNKTLASLPDPNFSLSLLELKISQIQENNRLKQGLKLRYYIQTDPHNTLRQCHPKKYPKCHCQLLAIRLILQEPPQKISEIARELNIKEQTIYSHWKRKCIPLLRETAKLLNI